MNKKYLLSSVTAGIALLYANHGTAQCVSTQDCAALGYTETSCPNGKGVKCPFGNKWFCASTEITPEQCTELGFTLTCTGTNQTGGAGKTCNGKYNYCSCTDGYVWQNGACKQSAPDYSDCVVGALFYSDNTCSSKYISSKTLLGIVIYEKSGNENGWVMTHKPIATNIVWSTKTVDIPGLSNCTSTSCLTDIQASCTNTNKITAQDNSSKYPAAWAAKNYKEGGKTWCLPSGGLLRNALDNSANFTKFNAAILEIQSKAGTSAATILGNVYNGDERVWSSSEYDYGNAWNFFANTSGSFYMGTTNKSNDYSGNSVRPVLAF